MYKLKNYTIILLYPSVKDIHEASKNKTQYFT